MSAPRLRLKAVRVQPIFVLDDGDTLTDVVYRQDADGQVTDHPVVVIPAAEWPTYSSERFPAEVKAWQAQIDAEHAATNGNRAQRRAAAGKPKAKRATSSALREKRNVRIN